MAHGGIALDLQEDEVRAALLKHEAIISKCAQEFACHNSTFLKYVYKYPACEELMRRFQLGLDKMVLDMAEDNIVTMLDACHPTATFFVLNTKGQVRGWLPPELAAAREHAAQAETVKLALDEMQELAELKEALKRDPDGIRAAIKRAQEVYDKSQSTDPVPS